MIVDSTPYTRLQFFLRHRISSELSEGHKRLYGICFAAVPPLFHGAFPRVGDMEPGVHVPLGSSNVVGNDCRSLSVVLPLSGQLDNFVVEVF